MPTMKEIDSCDMEILKHLADGKTQKEIAPLVNLSVKTIEWRLRKIRKAFNYRNTIELLLKLQNNAAL